MTKTILLIEPNVTYRQIICNIINESGFKPNIQPTPDETILYLRTKRVSDFPHAYFVEPLNVGTHYIIPETETQITSLSVHTYLKGRNANTNRFYILTDLISVEPNTRKKTWENTSLIHALSEDDQQTFRLLETQNQIIAKTQIDELFEILEEVQRQ